MTLRCFLCTWIYESDYLIKDHLNDTHDWESENVLLNNKFTGFARQMCPYCSKGFRSHDKCLRHVLSTCPTNGGVDLYSDRHNHVLSILNEAVTLCFPKRDWKILNGLQNPYYPLPLGVENQLGCPRPDILVFSKMMRKVTMIKLSIAWETIIPMAGLSAHARMTVWSNQFAERGYTCSCYHVAIGVRGLVSYSFRECLRDLNLGDDDIIQEYATLCSETATEHSRRILQGQPRE